MYFCNVKQNNFTNLFRSAIYGLYMIVVTLLKESFMENIDFKRIEGMTEMVSYLSNFREETPAWIGRYLSGEHISFKDIMSSRVGYYPGSGTDGTLIMVGNQSHSVHSFLYVDYDLGRNELNEQIDNIRGYHKIGQIEWSEVDLLPNGQYPLDRDLPNPSIDPMFFVNTEEQAYCFSVFFERDNNKDDSWGAEHFVVTFLFADGIATYYQLFVKEYNKAPWLFLLQDHGLGGNYDCFGRGGLLDAIINKSELYPDLVICGANTKIWRDYLKIEMVLPVYGGMHNNRRDLYERNVGNLLH